MECFYQLNLSIVSDHCHCKQVSDKKYFDIVRVMVAMIQLDPRAPSPRTGSRSVIEISRIWHFTSPHI